MTKKSYRRHGISISLAMPAPWLQSMVSNLGLDVCKLHKHEASAEQKKVYNRLRRQRISEAAKLDAERLGTSLFFFTTTTTVLIIYDFHFVEFYSFISRFVMSGSANRY